MEKIGLGRKVLVVDDKLYLVDMAMTIMQEMGFEVVAAFSGEEAVKRIDGTFYAVFTDLNMFALSGNDVARHVNGVDEGIRVILAYSPGNVEPEHGLYHQVLKKPYIVKELFNALA